MFCEVPGFCSMSAGGICPRVAGPQGPVVASGTSMACVQRYPGVGAYSEMGRFGFIWRLCMDLRTLVGIKGENDSE